MKKRLLLIMLTASLIITEMAVPSKIYADDKPAKSLERSFDELYDDGNLIAEDDKWIYYNDTDRGGMFAESKEKSLTLKLTDFQTANINVYLDTLYFTDISHSMTFETDNGLSTEEICAGGRLYKIAGLSDLEKGFTVQAIGYSDCSYYKLKFDISGFYGILAMSDGSTEYVRLDTRGEVQGHISMGPSETIVNSIELGGYLYLEIMTDPSVSDEYSGYILCIDRDGGTGRRTMVYGMNMHLVSGRIVYQSSSDLYLYAIEPGTDRAYVISYYPVSNFYFYNGFIMCKGFTPYAEVGLVISKDIWAAPFDSTWYTAVNEWNNMIELAAAPTHKKHAEEYGPYITPEIAKILKNRQRGLNDDGTIPGLSDSSSSGGSSTSTSGGSSSSNSSSGGNSSSNSSSGGNSSSNSSSGGNKSGGGTGTGDNGNKNGGTGIDPTKKIGGLSRGPVTQGTGTGGNGGNPGTDNNGSNNDPGTGDNGNNNNSGKDNTGNVKDTGSAGKDPFADRIFVIPGEYLTKRAPGCNIAIGPDGKARMTWDDIICYIDSPEDKVDNGGSPKQSKRNSGTASSGSNDTSGSSTSSSSSSSTEPAVKEPEKPDPDLARVEVDELYRYVLNLGESNYGMWYNEDFNAFLNYYGATDFYSDINSLMFDFSGQLNGYGLSDDQIKSIVELVKDTIKNSIEKIGYDADVKEVSADGKTVIVRVTADSHFSTPDDNYIMSVLSGTSWMQEAGISRNDSQSEIMYKAVLYVFRNASFNKDEARMCDLKLEYIDSEQHWRVVAGLGSFGDMIVDEKYTYKEVTLDTPSDDGKTSKSLMDIYNEYNTEDPNITEAREELDRLELGTVKFAKYRMFADLQKNMSPRMKDRYAYNKLLKDHSLSEIESALGNDVGFRGMLSLMSDRERQNLKANLEALKKDYERGYEASGYDTNIFKFRFIASPRNDAFYKPKIEALDYMIRCVRDYKPQTVSDKIGAAYDTRFNPIPYEKQREYTKTAAELAGYLVTDNLIVGADYYWDKEN